MGKTVYSQHHTKTEKILFFCMVSTVLIAVLTIFSTTILTNTFYTHIKAGDIFVKVGDYTAALQEYKNAPKIFTSEQDSIARRVQNLESEKKNTQTYELALASFNENNFTESAKLFASIDQNSILSSTTSEKLIYAKSIQQHEENVTTQITQLVNTANANIKDNQLEDGLSKLVTAYQIEQSDPIINAVIPSTTITPTPEPTVTPNKISPSVSITPTPKVIPATQLAQQISSLQIQIQKQKDDAAKAAAAAAAKNIAEEYVLQVPILMYHYIRVNPIPSDTLGFSLSVTPDDFNDQMNYLASNHYTTITMMDLVNALKNKTSLPPKPIILTFDDGYKDFYANAYPILSKYNLKGEDYVITNFVGQSNYLTWDMIKELSDSSLITIGSHTQDHLDMRSLSLTRLDQELAGSKKDLEDHIGKPVTDFCYPYGFFNELAINEVSKAGYLDATTTAFGTLHSNDNNFTMQRVRISGGTGLSTFIREIQS